MYSNICSQYTVNIYTVSYPDIFSYHSYPISMGHPIIEPKYL